MNIDDVPIGGNKKQDFSEFPEEEQATPQATDDGPLEDRILSKKWNVRAAAYEELTTQIQNTHDDSDPIFSIHAPGFKKYLADSNPGALEKALNLLSEFLRKASVYVITEMQTETLKLLITKCGSHMKPVIKQQACECAALFPWSTNNFENLSEPFVECMKSSNIKAQQAAVTMAVHILQCFGVQNVKVMEFCEGAIKVVSSANKMVRTAGLNFYEECYRWVGEAIKGSTAQLNKPQQDELEKAFKKIDEAGEPKPKPSMKTKIQEEQAKDAQIDDLIKQEEEEKEADPYDFAMEQDILSQFGAEWADGVDKLKKWDEKVAELENVMAKISVPKIKASDYQFVVQVTTAQMKSSNIKISHSATKLCAPLADGLREHFHEGAKLLVPILVNKFKEKRPQIIEDVKKSFKSFQKCVGLSDILESIVGGINEKTPSVKINCCLTVEDYARVTYVDELQDTFEELFGPLLECTKHSNSDVRDAALSCIGVLKQRCGESHFTKHASEFNDQKMNKIKEAEATVTPSKFDRTKAEATKPKVEKAAPQPDVEDDLNMDFGPPKKKKKKKKGPPKGFLDRQNQKEEEKQNNLEELKAELNGEQLPEQAIGNEEVLDAPMPPKKKQPKLSSAPVEDDPMGAPPMEQEAIPPMGGGRAAVGGGGYDIEAAMAAAAAEEQKAGGNAGNQNQSNPGDKVPKIPTEAKHTINESGQAMDKEEAKVYLEEKGAGAALKLFDEAKWQDKVSGYQKLGEFLLENDLTNDLIEASFRFVKSKLKDFKESNRNLVKAALNFIIEVVGPAPKLGKRAASVVLPFLADKVGDKISKPLAFPAINYIAELVTPGVACKHIVKQGMTAKNPNVLIEINITIVSLLNDFGSGGVPLEDNINFCKLCLANSNQKVRNEAIEHVKTLYLHFGKAIEPLLKDVKESTKKIIDKEFEKLTPYKKGEFKSKKAVLDEDAKEEVSGDPLASLPRKVITKELNSKLITLMSDSNWKKRGEAKKKIEEILDGANMRIENKGLADLFGAIKLRLSDSNKSVLKQYIQLTGKLAEAIGPSIKSQNKGLLKPVVVNMADKQTLVRDVTLSCMNQWAEAAGPETMISIIGGCLAQENLEIRTGLLNWILENKSCLNKSENETLIKSSIKCIQDKSPDIRKMTEDMIEALLPTTGLEQFKDHCQDLKPAVKQTVHQTLEKVRARSGYSGEEPDDEPVKADPPKKKAKKDKMQQSFKGSQRDEEEDPPTPKPVKEKKTPGPRQSKLGQNKAPPRKKKGEEDECNDLTLLISEKIREKDKDKREIADKKAKWEAEEVREDYQQKLEAQIEQILGEKVMFKMFSTDMKKHLEIIKMFTACFDGEEEEANNFLSIIDLVIKWSFVKSFKEGGTNLKFMKELFIFLEAMVKMCIENSYMIAEGEASILFCLLTAKAGMNNATLRGHVKQIILLIANSDIVDTRFCFGQIMNALSTKNNKTKAECLDLVTVLLKENQIQPTAKEMKKIAKLVDESDKGVRENSLRACVEVYQLIQEDFWVNVNKVLTSKANDLLRSRFKSIPGLMQDDSKPEKAEKAGKKKGTGSSRLNQSLKNSTFGSNKKSKLDNKNVTTPRKSVMYKENPLNKLANKGQDVLQRPATANASKLGMKSVKSSLKFSPGQQDGYSDEDNEQAPQPIEAWGETAPPPSERSEDDPFPIRCTTNEGQDCLDTIGEAIKMLKYSDYPKRVDALVVLNENVTQQLEQSRESLIMNSNYLVHTLSYVINDIFCKGLDELPYKFGKYFFANVTRMCSIKFVLQATSEEHILVLAEQLLLKLLVKGLDKIGEKQEGEQIFKNINSVILRLLENCHPNSIFCCMLMLLTKYLGRDDYPRACSVLIKCLLKLTKNLFQTKEDETNVGEIEENISKLNTSRILLLLHNYLVKTKQHFDDMGLRLAKTIINELVKVRNDKIWIDYESVEAHPEDDQYIQRWCEFILAKQTEQATQVVAEPVGSRPRTKATTDPNQIPMDKLQFLKKKVEEAKDENLQQQAFIDLSDFQNANPSISVEKYLSENVGDQFKQFILDGIKHPHGPPVKTSQLSAPKPLSTPNTGLKNPSTISTSGKLDRFKHMKEKMNAKAKKFNEGEQGNLKASPNDRGKTIKELNSSLTQRWSQISKKSFGTKSLLGKTVGTGAPSGLNNTIGAGFKSQTSALNNASIGANGARSSSKGKTQNDKSEKGQMLENRLNQLKSKLSAMKKKKE